MSRATGLDSVSSTPRSLCMTPATRARVELVEQDLKASVEVGMSLLTKLTETEASYQDEMQRKDAQIQELMRVIEELGEREQDRVHRMRTQVTETLSLRSELLGATAQLERLHEQVEREKASRAALEDAVAFERERRRKYLYSPDSEAISTPRTERASAARFTSTSTARNITTVPTRWSRSATVSHGAPFPPARASYLRSSNPPPDPCRGIDVASECVPLGDEGEGDTKQVCSTHTVASPPPRVVASDRSLSPTPRITGGAVGRPADPPRAVDPPYHTTLPSGRLRASTSNFALSNLSPSSPPFTLPYRGAVCSSVRSAPVAHTPTPVKSAAWRRTTLAAAAAMRLPPSPGGRAGGAERVSRGQLYGTPPLASHSRTPTVSCGRASDVGQPFGMSFDASSQPRSNRSPVAAGDVDVATASDAPRLSAVAPWPALPSVDLSFAPLLPPPSARSARTAAPTARASMGVGVLTPDPHAPPLHPSATPPSRPSPPDLFGQRGQRRSAPCTEGMSGSGYSLPAGGGRVLCEDAVPLCDVSNAQHGDSMARSECGGRLSGATARTRAPLCPTEVEAAVVRLRDSGGDTSLSLMTSARLRKFGRGVRLSGGVSGGSGKVRVVARYTERGEEAPAGEELHPPPVGEVPEQVSASGSESSGETVVGNEVDVCDVELQVVRALGRERGEEMEMVRQHACASGGAVRSPTVEPGGAVCEDVGRFRNVAVWGEEVDAEGVGEGGGSPTASALEHLDRCGAVARSGCEDGQLPEGHACTPYSKRSGGDGDSTTEYHQGDGGRDWRGWGRSAPSPAGRIECFSRRVSIPRLCLTGTGGEDSIAMGQMGVTGGGEVCSGGDREGVADGVRATLTPISPHEVLDKVQGEVSDAFAAAAAAARCDSSTPPLEDSATQCTHRLWSGGVHDTGPLSARYSSCARHLFTPRLSVREGGGPFASPRCPLSSRAVDAEWMDEGGRNACRGDVGVDSGEGVYVHMLSHTTSRHRTPTGRVRDPFCGQSFCTPM